MLQAILITAYKDFDSLIDIVSYFHEGFEIYIHIDKKHKPSKEIIDRINSFPQVKLLSFKYKVNYAGRNHLRCILHLAEEALKSEHVEYFHVISGQDFPVKPLSYFHKFVEENKSKDYLENFSLPNNQWQNGGMDRLELFSFYDLFDSKKHLSIIKMHL